MRTNCIQLPEGVRRHFANRGYHCLDEQQPEFGGIVLFLQRERGGQEAAFYISKPSAIELVTSDELSHVLDFLETRDIPLRHVVTDSPLSAASEKLTEKNRIKVWEPQTRYVEVVRPIVDYAHIRRLLFTLRVIFIG